MSPKRVKVACSAAKSFFLGADLNKETQLPADSAACTSRTSETKTYWCLRASGRVDRYSIPNTWSPLVDF